MRTSFVTIQSNAKQLAKLQDRRIAAFVKNLEMAQPHLMRMVHKTAYFASSGPYSYEFQAGARKVRGFGLYSKAHPSPPLHPGILNVHSQSIRDGWVVKTNLTSNGLFTIKIGNKSPHFDLSQGGPGSKMMDRPTITLIQQMDHDAFFKAMRLAKNNALRTH